MDKQSLLKDDAFIRDARIFLADRGGFDAEQLADREDVYAKFMEHFRFQNVNEVTAVSDLLYAQNTDDEGKQRMARLMDTYDNMESDLDLNAVGDYAAGIFSAPSTYAGVLTGGGAKIGATAAQAGVKLGIREAIKGFGRKELANAATQGVVRGAAVEAAIGAGQVAAQEQTRVETGMQEEISGARVGIGAVAGAVPGAVIGGITNVQKATAANVAERTARMTALKATSNARKANATKVKKTFEEIDDTKDIYKELLSLRETIPEKLGRGEELQKYLAPDDLKITKGDKSFAIPGAFSFSDQVLQNMAAFAAKFIDEVPDLAGIEGTERFTSKLARVFESGEVKIKDKNGKLVTHRMDAEFLSNFAKEYGVTLEDVGALMAAEFSRAGKTLNVASQLSKAEKKRRIGVLNQIETSLGDAGQAITNPSREAIDELEAKLGKNTIQKSLSYLGDINKARIGLMTIQLATTTRNITNGYMRNYVYAFDNLGSGLYNAAKGKLKGYSPTDEVAKAEAERSVKLGVAQMKTAMDAFLFKDMMLGLTGADSSALARLMKDPAFGQSEQAKQVFMDMGDVANHIGSDSGVLKLARTLNKLNTKSDNMFKRAILSRELDKEIRAAGYEGGLSAVLKSGKFTDIDDSVIARGMEKALDYTYQTGRFRGKEGIFNTVAQAFIDVSQTQLGSTFVPFPRYLVNQFRFFYEHAPILGLFDFGGILNKSDFGDRVGKQIGGYATLGALYALRSNHGDETTGPFEYANPYGSGLVDARASLGPFTAHAAIADAIYRLTEDFGEKEGQIKRPVDYKDLLEALGGGQFRPTGLNLIDGAFETIQSGVQNGETDIVIDEMLATYFGNYFNTYTVGAGVIKDVVATLDPEFRTVTDNRDIEFWPYFFKQATRSFPQSVNAQGDFYGYSGFGPARERLESPTRSTGLRVLNPFMRQLTGLTQQEPRNIAEKEFDRLGLEYFQITPQKIKGDPEFTNQSRYEMGKLVETGVVDYILNDPMYNDPGLSNVEKEAGLMAVVNEFRGRARKAVLDPDRYQINASGEVPLAMQYRVAQAQYLALPSKTKDLISVYYERETGKSLAGEDEDRFLVAMYIKQKYNIK